MRSNKSRTRRKSTERMSRLEVEHFYGSKAGERGPDRKRDEGAGSCA